MILVFYEDDVFQSADYDEEGLEVLWRAGADIYRFEASFYIYEQYLGRGQWTRDIPRKRYRGTDFTMDEIEAPDD